MPKILLVQTGFIGDILLSSPVITELRRLFPQAELSLLTTPQGAELALFDPLLKEVIVYDKKKSDKGLKGFLKLARVLSKRKFDSVFSLHRSYRTALLLFLARIPVRVGFSDASSSFLYTRKRERSREVHQVLRNLGLVSDDIPLRELDSLCTKSGAVPKVPLTHTLRLDLGVTASAKEILDRLDSLESNFLSNSPRGYVVLAPGSVWETKRWRLEGFSDIAEFFVENGISVVLLGSKSEKELGDGIVQSTLSQSAEAKSGRVLNLIGKLPLLESFRLLESAKILVCNDSMLQHGAAALSVPTVAVFCSTAPAQGFTPWTPVAAEVVGDDSLECRPCFRTGLAACPLGTYACRENVDATRVKQAAERVWRASYGESILKPLSKVL